MVIQALVPTLRGGTQLRLTAKGKSKGRDQQESVIIDSSVSGDSGRGEGRKAPGMFLTVFIGRFAYASSRNVYSLRVSLTCKEAPYV